jgi:hypothetical protein
VNTDTAQPALGAGPVTLPTFDCADEGGSLTHSPPSTGAWTIERGWSVDNATNWDGVFKAVVTAYTNYYTAIQNTWHYQLEFRDIRFYPLGPDGKMVTLAPCIARPNTTMAPGGGAGLSPDWSVVLSHYSALRSKRGRGRWYHGPLGTVLMSAPGTINPTTGTLLATKHRDFLQAMRAVSSGAIPVARKLTPVILHRAAPYKTAAVINRVRVGDEFDGQERRTKSRPEVFTDANLT